LYYQADVWHLTGWSRLSILRVYVWKRKLDI